MKLFNEAHKKLSYITLKSSKATKANRLNSKVGLRYKHEAAVNHGIFHWPALLTRSTILIALIAKVVIHATSANKRTAARVSFRFLNDPGQVLTARSLLSAQSSFRPSVSNAKLKFAELNAMKNKSKKIRRSLADGDLSPRGLLLYSSKVMYMIYTIATESKMIAKRVEEVCTQQGLSEELLSSQAAKPRARVENVSTIKRTTSGKIGFRRMILFE